ncbi:MAG TPA: class I SAM-dependent methyltransferase [Polyangiaceae bacterium]|nr:class I SAM-dependent methyltransferase [Polyangiaceae bacterium]
MSAELYALTHRGNRGDLEFYQRTCRGARSVLELGSGYGRVLTALANAERRVVGLERDPQFLALARRNLRQLSPKKRQSVRLVHGDLRDFRLAERFERVLLPYNALYCLLSKQAALACFRSVQRALEPGGVFAFDVWNAAAFDAAAGTLPDDDEPIVSLRHDARTWDVFERSRVRRARKRLDVTYHYLPREGGAAQRIVIPQRYYLAPEVDELLERAGFAVQARYGDFSGGRFTARSAQQVVLARAL